jgi:hypothetical protein
MKIERRELEIELIAETEFEKSCLNALLGQGPLQPEYGRNMDSWNPRDTRVAVLFKLPDPSKW